MKFFLHLSFRLLGWSFIFGFIIGIFGVSLSLMQIADFYLEEGTENVANTYTFNVKPTSTKSLTETSIVELQNVEGVAFADPYFTPAIETIGAINYFGFNASYPLQIQGIPSRLGREQAVATHRSEWESADLNRIPVLLPQQAVTLYNNLAPQRSWPTLDEKAFLGLPGTSILIQENSYQAIISGFDAEEFGMTIKAPAQKLYAIFADLDLSPSYDYINIETVAGLNRQQARNTAKSITDLGYSLAKSNEEDFQQSLFKRIKYTIGIFAISILIAFIILLFYDMYHLLKPIQIRISHYRLWGIKDTTFIRAMFLFGMFAICSGIISWIICFFAVIPVQEYITSTISRFGFNVPSLRESARVALEAGVLGIVLFFLTNTITIVTFYRKIPPSYYIKKF